MTAASSSASPTAPAHVRHAHDADQIEALKENPDDAEAKLEVALDASFPGSDAPAITPPCGSTEPAPSSGFDEEAEKALAEKSK